MANYILLSYSNSKMEALDTKREYYGAAEPPIRCGN